MKTKRCSDFVKTVWVSQSGRDVKFFDWPKMSLMFPLYFTHVNLEVRCPINQMMARWMARTAKFVVDFNGVKGSKMTMINFATSQEVDVFRKQYLGSDNWPISAVGIYARGSYGTEDEVYGKPAIVSIR